MGNVKQLKPKHTEKEYVEQLVTLMSIAAQKGNERALKVMDEAQLILTTEWDQLPLRLREDMAYVTAELLFKPVELDDDQEELEG